MSRLLIRISFWHVFIALNFLLFMVLPSAYANGLVHHELDVTVEPITSEIRVQDKFYMKTTRANCDSYSFYLNEKIKIDRARISNGWKFSVESSYAGDARLQKLLIQKKSSESCPEEMVVSLSYSGLVSKNSESKNDSIVSEGFVFSGSEYFYPVQTNPNSRVTFEMEVSLPQGWKSVSQGMREIIRLTKGRRVVKWSSNLPSEDIILIGNRFYIYEEMYEGINLYAFLLKNEVRLANKYIQTAKYYIDFYSKLLGSYPYSKFALVENSKQTGYGMPSFTLMGSRIIRFPFILHSSFPHEILHNWWGNGVFIDSNSGNWSEGLTAYLADHLLLELKGKGSQYRFQEMLKYRSYVNDSNEFAINRFSHRDSMASQAIGYGKLMMVFHMLRTQLGKEIFLQSLRDFYNGYKYRHAGFREIKETFEEISGKKLDWFFE